MDSLAESLSPAELETVRRALRATVEGSFFPDWEFVTLFGVDRNTVQKVHAAWPQRTVEQDEFVCAVINSLNNLLGYPHGSDDELVAYLPERREALERVLKRLVALGL